MNGLAGGDTGRSELAMFDLVLLVPLLLVVAAVCLVVYLVRR